MFFLQSIVIKLEKNVPSSTWIPFPLKLCRRPHVMENIHSSSNATHSSSNGGRILQGLWQFTQEAASYQPRRVHFCGKCQPLTTASLSPPTSTPYIATFREILLDCTFFKLSSCGMFIEKIDIEYEKLILLWVTEYNIQYFRLCFLISTSAGVRQTALSSTPIQFSKYTWDVFSRS